MRQVRRNRQIMHYSIPTGLSPKYKTDSEGNIVYIVVDGVSEPVETGEYEQSYSTPVQFEANISSTLASAAFRPFGIDNSATKAVISCEKDWVGLVNGAIVWKKTDIRYKADGTPDVSSADYRVVGVCNEGIDSDLFLLEKMNPNEVESTS